VGFDVGGYVRRARRVADLSQRDLADILGLSRAAVGRLESTPGRVDLPTMEAILALADLRLAVVDSAGRPVEAVPADTLRDHGNRRFPAHLDATPPDIGFPNERGVQPRRGLPPARGWYRQRQERNRLRERGRAPEDHPTDRSERERAAGERQRRRNMALAALRASPPQECTCLDDCFELACLPDCPCQCEPPRTDAWTAGLWK
jgi:HTH-type transcriptional regulator/antitoxin HipB